MIERRYDIDLLRVIGIIAIVLAHVGTVPNVIMQIRNFDVVLMVFIMGMSFVITGGDKGDYKAYVKKRFMRLVVPVWLFLVFFFVFFNLICFINGSNLFSLQDYIDSFLLSSGLPGSKGCNYVWIFRVYFLMALVSPLIMKLIGQMSAKKAFGVLLACLVLYELLVYLFVDMLNINENILVQILLYGFGYSIVCGIGIYLSKLVKKKIILLMLVFGVIYFVLAVANAFQNTQIAKYPPQIYYLSYAIFASMFLYLLAGTKYGVRLGRSVPIQWLSQNSFWLYLWHMLPLWLLKLKIIVLPTENFIIRFFFIFVVAFSLTLLHNVLRLFFRKIRRMA